MNIFSHAERLVQTYGRSISRVRLNEDDIDPPFFGHTLERPDEIRGNPFAAMLGPPAVMPGPAAVMLRPPAVML
jgi:hypothetical protein